MKIVKFKITGKTVEIKESTTWNDISDNIRGFMKGLFHWNDFIKGNKQKV